MATNETGHKHYHRKYAIVAALALVIAASTFTYLPAASASSAAISANPKVSQHDSGKSIFLFVRFMSDTANPVQTISVDVQNDTSQHLVLQFTPAGQIISGDPSVFLSVQGNTKFKDEGGYGGHGKVIGNFHIRVAKKPLSYGDHPTSLNVALQGAPSLTADTTFTLKGHPKTPADIVANYVFASENIGKNHKVHAVAILSNTGGSTTGPFQTTLYLSTDATLDGSDTAIGMKNVGSMTAGSFRIVELEGTIPSGTHGPYYLIANGDSGNVVPESNENNNWVATTGTITVP